MVSGCFWLVLVDFWLVSGWFLVGSGWFLVGSGLFLAGFWLASSWFLVSFWLVSGWFLVGFWFWFLVGETLPVCVDLCILPSEVPQLPAQALAGGASRVAHRISLMSPRIP